MSGAHPFVTACSGSTVVTLADLTKGAQCMISAHEQGASEHISGYLTDPGFLTTPR